MSEEGRASEGELYKATPPAVPEPTQEDLERDLGIIYAIVSTGRALMTWDESMALLRRTAHAEAALDAHKASEQREVEALEELRRRDPALARHVEEEHREHGWVKVHVGHHKVDSMVREAVDENKRLVAALAASREENAELRKLLEARKGEYE